MKCVLDTGVIVAALRSPSGASAALLMAARRSDLTMVANVAMVLECEAACSRAEHVLASRLSMHQVGLFLDALVAMAEPVETHFLWRPLLRDPAEERVLEAAVNGQAAAIVTFNQRDFGAVPMQFGSTYPLRLPTSVKAEVVRWAKAEGTSFNQFVATAVAEKLATMNTAAFFAERRGRADFDAFDRLMQRQGGEPPRPEDLVP